MVLRSIVRRDGLHDVLRVGGIMTRWIVVYRDVVCGGVSMAYICKEATSEDEAREEFLHRSGGHKGWEIVRVKQEVAV